MVVFQKKQSRSGFYEESSNFNEVGPENDSVPKNGVEVVFLWISATLIFFFFDFSRE